MQTFISYAKDIKNTAGKIRKFLDQFGFNCFLAHEDIPPQTVWPAKIMEALEKCDLFLPLLTNGFIKSFYCQQETGFAYCRDVEILPIKITKAPMGMIADIQAVAFNRKNFEPSCWIIINHVAKNGSFSKPILDALIGWLGDSESYETANERAKKTLKNFEYSSKQVKTIRKHIKSNSQIYETKHARDSIFKFMDRYSEFFDAEYRNWYDSKKASRMWMRY